MTVIYAIIGIPLMLITLRDLGNFLYRVMISIVRLMHFITSLCGISRRTVNKISIQSNKNDLALLESGLDHSNVEHENENNDNGSIKPQFQLDNEFNEGKFN